MLRVVVALGLAVALLAVSVPALETARSEHSDRRVSAELNELTAAIADLQAREAAVRTDRVQPRRVVTVRLPGRSWTDAGIEYVAIGGHPDRPAGDERTESAIVWRTTGGRVRTRSLPGVSVEADTADRDDGPLVIREPGRHRLAVSLVAREHRTVVTVREVER